MRDFTRSIYRELLSTLLDSGFEFYVLEDLCGGEMKEPYIVLRHDVDRNPKNALRMAEIENSMGIKATYYFRTVKKVFDPEIIKKISSMGHEVGYHYEDLSTLHGDVEEALKSFKRNVEILRVIAPVNTVSMHGKPLSKYDNRKLIPLLNFTELGILCEPYTIVEKLELVYLTDTGRSWNNRLVNVRDRVSTTLNIKVKSTQQLIDAIGKELSDKNMMLNIHPERWEDAVLPWVWNLVWQRLKNSVKYALIKVSYGE
jgi:hypothetical protein